MKIKDYEAYLLIGVEEKGKYGSGDEFEILFESDAPEDALGLLCTLVNYISERFNIPIEEIYNLCEAIAEPETEPEYWS